MSKKPKPVQPLSLYRCEFDSLTFQIMHLFRQIEFDGYLTIERRQSKLDELKLLVKQRDQLNPEEIKNG